MKNLFRKSFVRLAAALTCCCLTVSAAACHRVAGSSVYIGTMYLQKTECGLIAGNCGSYYDLDLSEKSFRVLESGEEGGAAEDLKCVLNGGTAPRDSFEIAEGYEKAENHLLSLCLPDDRSVLFAFGYESGDKVMTGFCNVYKDTVGYLSGGGNYGSEEISHSVLFTYDAAQDRFEERERVEGLVVGYMDDRAVYWKDRKFYAIDFTMGESSFVAEDRYYNTVTPFRECNDKVLFGREYLVLINIVDKGTWNELFMTCYRWDSGEVFSLTEMKDEK